MQNAAFMYKEALRSNEIILEYQSRDKIANKKYASTNR